MQAVRKVWHLLPHDVVAIEQLARALQVTPIIAQLLLNRHLPDISSAKRFLETPLVGLHPVASLPGIPEAVERLYQAIQNKKKICIYGDYDVDGVTGTSILWGLLNLLEVPVEFYVPHRLEEGYGLNSEALMSLQQKGISTVVTVDCGITSLNEAQTARQLGLELIITDHHEMKETLPQADVLVHPNLPGKSYPFTGLSGAGVAFKLAWALAVKVCGSEKVTPKLREYLLDSLALATLGLVADVVPLLDENRILVRHGLLRLQNKPPLGMKALIEAAGLKANTELRAEDIAYKLAPRMNAAGRLGYAGLVVEMLTTNQPAHALELAKYLESENSKRQIIERQITNQAKELLQDVDWKQVPAVVVADKSWHPGVIGIVASRLVDQFGRPALVIAPQEGKPFAAGSGRSIPGFHLHQALKACEQDLIGHGGHAMAVGFKIGPDKIDSFRQRFCDYAATHFPDGVPQAPRITIDAEIPLSALSFGLVNDLRKLEPYGAQNPKPKFLAGNLQIIGEPRRIGKGELHLSFRVRQGTTTMRAVAFGMGQRLDELMTEQGQCCVVFEPTINEWNGYKNVEIHIIDFQAGSSAKLD